MKNIFVYGTLKKGYGNHVLLKGAEFLGEKVIWGFKLYESGIPYMKRSESPEDFVLGEVYAVTSDSMLADLDRLEGHPTWYRREVIDSGADNDLREIEGYVYQKGVVPGTESPKVDGVFVYGRERRI